MAKILIADDEPDIARLWSTILNKLGHETFIARDGAEAVQLMESKAFDLLIMDIFMPNRDGFEVLRWLKERSERPKTLVISGGDRVNVSFLEMAKHFGAMRTLEKPVSLDLFKKTVDELLNAA